MNVLFRFKLSNRCALCTDEPMLQDFHFVGHETWKARLPNFRFVRSTVKSPLVDDRSTLELEAEYGVPMDDGYDGEVPE